MIPEVHGRSAHADGGHKAIHPQLGTAKDFRQFLDKARSHGLEIALDLAFQCSPDHPYVKEHREWFKIRPDGTVQYAENPPKKYQDIYPLEFESDQWQSLWQELKSVILYWIEQGVRIFRVDNPHTKPFAFWEWLIREIQEDHPGCHLSGRSVHATKSDVPVGEAGLYPVLYLFRLAQYERQSSWNISRN